MKVVNTFQAQGASTLTTAQKQALISEIPPDASLIAPMPYQSHLALRKELYSLHFIFKGRQTLSQMPYTPPENVEYVLIDYRDASIFRPGQGFFSGGFISPDGKVVESSDRLLHLFLSKSYWESHLINELVLFKRSNPSDAIFFSGRASENGLVSFGKHTRLLYLQPQKNTFRALEPLKIGMLWRFYGTRGFVPWMSIKFSPVNPSENTEEHWVTRGLCLPQGFDNGKVWREVWDVLPPEAMRPGYYQITAVFQDQALLNVLMNRNPTRELKPLLTIEIGRVTLLQPR